MLVKCPECEGDVRTAGTMRGDVIACPDCGVELEVVAVNPPVLVMLEPDKEDYGE